MHPWLHDWPYPRLCLHHQFETSEARHAKCYLATNTFHLPVYPSTKLKMASLIIAAGIATTAKIQQNRENKREKKRKEHERRYSELEEEHRAYEDKYLSRRNTTSSGIEDRGGNQSSSNPFFDIEEEGKERRNSEDSHRSDSEDGPEKWVDDVVKQREKGDFDADGQQLKRRWTTGDAWEARDKKKKPTDPRALLKQWAMN